MRIMIRQQAPGFIFTPNHRISPRLSGKQPKSIDCHQLETGEVYEYSIYLLENFIVGHGETMAGNSVRIFHLSRLFSIFHL